MPDVVLSLRKEVEAAADASAQRAALVASITTQGKEMARALLFAAVDSEATEAGLTEAAPGAGGLLSLQAAREAIDAVAPGFLDQQDRNAQFVRDAVLGAAPSPPAPPTASAVERAAASTRSTRSVSTPQTTTAVDTLRPGQTACGYESMIVASCLPLSRSLATKSVVDIPLYAFIMW